MAKVPFGYKASIDLLSGRPGDSLSLTRNNNTVILIICQL